MPNAVQPFQIDTVKVFLDRGQDGTGDSSTDPNAIIFANGYFNVSTPCQDFTRSRSRGGADQRLEIRTS